MIGINRTATFRPLSHSCFLYNIRLMIGKNYITPTRLSQTTMTRPWQRENSGNVSLLAHRFGGWTNGAKRNESSGINWLRWCGRKRRWTLSVGAKRIGF
jgi:hypothetical protein